jgi:hypothetical protein
MKRNKLTFGSMFKLKCFFRPICLNRFFNKTIQIHLFRLTTFLLVLQTMQVVAQTAVFTTPGFNRWKCPEGVTSVTVECWGSGGGGGLGLLSPSGSAGSGGGGGGAYSKKNTVAVTPGSCYTVFVGFGRESDNTDADSYFIDNLTAMAKGGRSAQTGTSTGGVGGSAATSVGDIKYNGGNGSDGTVAFGGGGGSSAGTGADGNNGTGSTGGIAPTGGGQGGQGNTSGGGDGLPALIGPGGGGGGLVSQFGFTYGGRGANGQVILSWTPSATNPSFDFTTPGLSQWQCPAGITSVMVECYGAGGGGGGSDASGWGAPGGGGGAYVKRILPVVPGTIYNVYVGNGGAGGSGTTPDTRAGDGEASWFNTTATINASGGCGSLGTQSNWQLFGSYPGGFGGCRGGSTGNCSNLASACVPSFNSGSDVLAPGTSGGFGAINQPGAAGGKAGSCGGDGGAAILGGPGKPGGVPGGGGGGANYSPAANIRVSNENGGPGARGQVRITFSAACIPPTITATTPATRCGSGAVTLNAVASQGTISWFTSSSGGTAVGTGNSYSTPALSDTSVYYVEASANGCSSTQRTPVTATVNPAPVKPAIQHTN